MLHQGGKALVSYISAYYVNFQFPPRIHAPILPINYKRLQNIFNVVTKQRQIETQNALCNSSKSPHMCKLLIVWLGALCGLCIFCSYIDGLRLAFVSVWLIRLFIRSWIVWAFDGMRAQACLTVLCICKCRCKIYYTL